MIDHRRTHFTRTILTIPLMASCLFSGCMKPEKLATPQRPDVAPTELRETDQPLLLDPSTIKPMYTQMLAVDLPTALRVASAQNVDIQAARQSVEAMAGQYESAIGSAFPAIVPTAMFEHVEGSVRAAEGNLVGVGFNTFEASIAVQWIVNPGRVIYDIIAAKKRLLASEDQEQAIIQEALRRSAIQFYELVFNQARVAAADQGVKEAEELLRISRIREQTGTGVQADTLRAEARVAERQQDLVSAINDLYNASVALAVTLHLDASITLIPNIEELPPKQLVRDDIEIEEMLGIAVAFRPDLESVRKLAAAAQAEYGETWWRGFGPTLNVGYQYGGIASHADNIQPAGGVPGNLIVNPVSPTGSFSASPAANGLIREGILRGSRRLDHRSDQTFGFSDQQRAQAGAGWRLSLAIFGNLKSAKAGERRAIIEAERLLDEVRAQVVRAAQASDTNNQLIALSRHQVNAAEEALRLSQANLSAGTMTTLDVLQAQDAATQARLRYADAVVRYNQSQVNLLASLGLINRDVFETTRNVESAEG